MAGRFVLENEKGEVVRTFAIDSEEFYVIYRHDTRRVEVTSDINQLKENGVSFDVLKKTSAKTAMNRSVSLANGGRFRYTDHIAKTVSLTHLETDSDDQEKTIYKYTAYVQLGVMALILILGLLIEPLFVKKDVEEVVTVIPQQYIPKVERVTVSPSDKKVVPKKFANKRVVKPKTPVSKTLTAKAKSPVKANAPLRTKIKVDKVGALGALGGMKTGSKNSAGFYLNARNNSRGTSWSGAGAGGAGGMERAVHGKGLIVAASGQGGKVEGGGGYGTRGQAGGGRPGYGDMNLGGTAAAYFEPVTEEALVEGGLTKDQIAGVINRHIGEVIYCYEKGLQVKPKLSGRVGVNFTINGQGRVSAAGVGSSSLGDPSVEGCILNRLRKWSFPKPVGGVNVKVTYPFVLKRVNHG